jgi:predicted DNA-binding transcriptional regulator AlpA
MSSIANEKATLTEQEFCERVGISRTTAWRQRNAGKLPHCRIGDKVVYLPRHVDEFLANCERPARRSPRSQDDRRN